MKLGIVNNQVTLLTRQDDHLLGQMVRNTDTIFDAISNRSNLELSEKFEVNQKELQMPVPEPRQVFAVGMNYTDHSREINIALPKVPSIFTKFQSSLTDPNVTVKKHGNQTDWETELVIVIGKDGRNIAKENVDQFIAGYMVGQDLSDRFVQLENTDAPQFSMGKSFEKYGPVGPWLTTPDDIKDLGDLEIETRVNGIVMQHSQLKNMIFDTPTLVSYLSSIVELKSGDIIFTGTPSGVGLGRDPKVFLRSGDDLISEIEGLCQLHIEITE
ncbi:fumarylacetoacetate hydrolase [Pediococcus claussenii]|uniref:fumarylacetoacetate hydrolase family protein n=1 Tax=Pediococcus claussenii TaxID=187452 RepID=UPI00081A5CDF|nr:fumarylacetoacetate hydrolase family protein [Pediococcus claussenii]ANZ69529.1 fumarylacetoacetate hydrolase [Pediococcus claussenii]